MRRLQLALTFVIIIGAVTPLRVFASATHWTIQATPTPGGAQTTTLGGISCTAAKACTAVGITASPNTYAVPLAERWDGTKWLIQQTPVPVGARGAGLLG